jgi:hypothetical protein
MVGRVTLNSSAICWTVYLRLRRRRFPQHLPGERYLTRAQFRLLPAGSAARPGGGQSVHRALGH